VKLLVPDETRTKLVVVREGLDVLRKLGNETKVAVITFIGRARSGKSFTLDNLLHVPYETGFEVGHTNKPKTVGADIWPHLVKNDIQNISYLVFDTEGLGTGPQTYDKALLLLFALLSSRIVYHVSEYVYTDDISKLYGVACLAAHYDSRGMLSHRWGNATASDLLPAITWVVQKYRLSVSTASALDDWLGEKENIDNNPSIARFNTTVRIVHTLFSDHTIHLIPPAEPSDFVAARERKREGTRRLELTDIEREKLNPEYIHEMQNLENVLFNIEHTHPKQFGARTPAEIASAIIDLLPAANLGFEYVGDKVAETLSRAILAEILNNITSQMTDIVLPINGDQLESTISAIRRDAIFQLESNLPTHATAVVGMNPKNYFGDIDSRICLEADRLRKENEYQSDKLCGILAEKATQFFASSDQIHKFAGNFAIFDAAFDIAMSQYLEKAVGPAVDRHQLAIKIRATETRKLIAATVAPRKKILWSIASTVFLLCVHLVTNLVEKYYEWSSSIMVFSLIVALTLVQFVAVGVLVISVWSILDVPPIDFDSMTSFFLYALNPIYGISILVIVTVLFMITLYCGGSGINRKKNNEKKET